MCTISLLWSIGTDLTRCDFDLGSEQAWRNERLALSDMAVVLVQSQSGCSTGLGPVEAHYGTSFRAISTSVRPDGDNMLMPPTPFDGGGQLKAPPTRWSLRDRTRFLHAGTVPDILRARSEAAAHCSHAFGRERGLRLALARSFALTRYIEHLLMQLVLSEIRQAAPPV